MITTKRPSATRGHETAARSVGVRSLLALEMDESPDGVVRVLTLLRRRRCRITSIEFRDVDRHFRGLFVIGIEAPAAHAHCVRAWLENLVEVLAVESINR
jgi:prephenate dehydratase